MVAAGSAAISAQLTVIVGLLLLPQVFSASTCCEMSPHGHVSDGTLMTEHGQVLRVVVDVRHRKPEGFAPSGFPDVGVLMTCDAPRPSGACRRGWRGAGPGESFCLAVPRPCVHRSGRSRRSLWEMCCHLGGSCAEFSLAVDLPVSLLCFFVLKNATIGSGERGGWVKTSLLSCIGVQKLGTGHLLACDSC